MFAPVYVANDETDLRSWHQLSSSVRTKMQKNFSDVFEKGQWIYEEMFPPVKNKVSSHKLHRSFDETTRRKESHWCGNQITTAPSKRLNIYKEINCH